MIYGHLSCSWILFLIFNNRKIAEFKGVYDEKKNKTVLKQKLVLNTSADVCMLSVSICFQFQFLYIFWF